jgi:GH35 family endo-1,4-beta-xylanase
MKPGPVHPQENSWNWTQPDALVEFCQANNIKTFGHCLVWHSQTNPWFFEDADRDRTLSRLRDHIHTLVGRFKGKMSGWDVVNEAINDGNGDGSSENLRDSRWHQIVGPAYLTQAFKFAREADPAVPLHYNDYSIESGAKHQSSLLLLKRLISEGAPITTVGIQGHWSVTNLSAQKFEDIERAITNYKALRLKIAISELDVTLTGGGGGQLGRGQRGEVTPPSPDALAAQADAYGRLFALFAKHRDAIDRVTFWGLNDRRSWRRGQNPLVFDAANQPKPALQAIINSLTKI